MTPHELLRYIPEKLWPDEPCFLLRGQDVSAVLCVEFWIAVQLEVRQHIDDGMGVQEAVDHVRRAYRVAPWSQFEPLDDLKLSGAMAVAKAMRAFPGLKKVAD
jgi:hypothetical protein